MVPSAPLSLEMQLFKESTPLCQVTDEHLNNPTGRTQNESEDRFYSWKSWPSMSPGSTSMVSLPGCMNRAGWFYLQSPGRKGALLPSPAGECMVARCSPIQDCRVAKETRGRSRKLWNGLAAWMPGVAESRDSTTASSCGTGHRILLWLAMSQPQSTMDSTLKWGTEKSGESRETCLPDHLSKTHPFSISVCLFITCTLMSQLSLKKQPGCPSTSRRAAHTHSFPVQGAAAPAGLTGAHWGLCTLEQGENP